MDTTVHCFKLEFDWNLVNVISTIDRFDALWSSIEKREGKSLKQLKAIATVRSVGASTRIEGSKMTDNEVDILLNSIDINKLERRDEQEVVGYFNTLDLISGEHPRIDISENQLKNLHNILLKYSEKDDWHRGDYKKHSNAVEAVLPNGIKQVIFQTTEPGFATQDAMRSLVDWYHLDNSTHPLVKCALFAYEFVSIHPFQDGNGRLSRLLATLLLLKNGYAWIQYVSLEHEIENRKNEYYKVLRECQAERPGEDVTSWITFFFDALKNIQQQLSEKLNNQGVEAKLAPKEKSILLYISDHPGCKSGEISKRLAIPNQTVKRMLSELLSKNMIEHHGIGSGSNYSVK